jgi:hypothetical protein
MNIIIFSENNWDTPLKYQRHHLAEYFAKKEGVNKVFFFSKSAIRKINLIEVFQILSRKLLFYGLKNPKREVHKKIKIVNYYFFPFQSSFKLLNVNLKMKIFKIINNLNVDWNETVLISYQPIPIILEIISKYKPMKSVYVSVHDYEQMYGVSKRVISYEKKIISKVDLFTTDSKDLYDKLSPETERKIPLTPACPLESVKKSITRVYNSNKIKRLIYFGTIAKYLDWEVIETLLNEGYKVDFLGKEYDVKLSSDSIFKSCKIFSPIDFENAYELLSSYDAIILPYKLNDRNDLIIPAKIYECMSLGLPIITPNMKWTMNNEFKALLFLYSESHDLLYKLKKFDVSDFINNKRPLLLDLAKNNSWDNRFNKLNSWINE